MNYLELNRELYKMRHQRDMLVRRLDRVNAKLVRLAAADICKHPASARYTKGTARGRRWVVSCDICDALHASKKNKTAHSSTG